MRLLVGDGSALLWSDTGALLWSASGGEGARARVSRGADGVGGI